MVQNLTHRRYRQSGVRAVYNADSVTADQVAALLADNAQALFGEHSELIMETSNSRSYRVEALDRVFFAKQYKPPKWYRRVWGYFFPPCFASFRAGARMLKAELPTPLPILAAVVRQQEQPRYLLVTDFCRQAKGLDEAMIAMRNGKRAELIEELAGILAEFHCKGFYSRHLRSANILLTDKPTTANGPEPAVNALQKDFWFVDLDRLGSNRFLTSGIFVNTVSRACFEFYEEIPQSDRQHLLRTCFDAALKQNIFHKPSQEKWFLKTAINQINQRR